MALSASLLENSSLRRKHPKSGFAAVTGTEYVAIEQPKFECNVYCNLRASGNRDFPKTGDYESPTFRNWEVQLCTLVRKRWSSSLAGGTVMSSTTRYQDSSNGCSTDETGLAGSQVNAVLKLEESSNPVGVHII